MFALENYTTIMQHQQVTELPCFPRGWEIPTFAYTKRHEGLWWRRENAIYACWHYVVIFMIYKDQTWQKQKHENMIPNDSIEISQRKLCMSSRFRSKPHLCPWSFKIWRLSKKKIHRFFGSFGILQTFEMTQMTGVSFLPRSIHDWAPSPSWIGCVKSYRLVPKGASAPRCRELGWSKLFLGNWLKEWKCDCLKRIEFVFFIAFSWMPVAWNLEKHSSTRWSKLSKPDCVGQSLTTKSSQT